MLPVILSYVENQSTERNEDTYDSNNLFQPNQMLTVMKVNELALLIVLLHAGTCECPIDTHSLKIKCKL